MFYENFQSACKSSGTTPTAVVNKLGISKGSVTYWKNKIPNGSVIVQISELLNVSCDYLLTGKNSSSALLAADEQELTALIFSLDEIDRAEIRGTAKQMLKAEKYHKKQHPAASTAFMYNSDNVTRIAAFGGGVADDDDTPHHT